MQLFKKTPKYDFMGMSRFFASASAVAVLASLIAIFTIQPKFGIDFVGGSEIQVKFKDASVTPAEIRSVLAKMGFSGYDVVSFGNDKSEYLIQLKEVSTIAEGARKKYKDAFKTGISDAKLYKFEFSPGGDKLSLSLSRDIGIDAVEEVARKAGLDLGESVTEQGEVDEERDEDSSRRCESATCTWAFKNAQIYEISLAGVAEQVVEELRKETWGKGAVKLRSEWVGAKVGSQLRNAGIASLGYALLFIMVYIAFRFDFRFAPGAVIALIHDIIITLGIFTVFRVEVTLTTVAALLTIVGYSLNDTIVVFDRIRENLQITREVKLASLVNTSVNETLSRTIMTSATTIMATVVLLTLGWKTSLRDFSLALTIGIIIGTYSSIYIASPVVVWLDRFSSEKKA